MDSKRPWLKNYEPGVPHSIDYPEVPLYQFLDDSAKNYPDNTATIFDGAELTYKELQSQVNKFARALGELGVKKGDRVAIMLPNCPQAVISYYGALRAGAIVVETNPLYVERELAYQFNDSGAKTLVVLDLLWPRVKNIREKTKLRNIIITSLSEYREDVKVKPQEGCLSFKDLIEKAPEEAPKIKVAPEDVALFQYTGGTTGRSKGVMLTHRNLVCNAIQAAKWFPDFEPGQEIVLSALPFFHVYGMTCSMNVSILMGGPMILVWNPRDIKGLLEASDKHKPTFFLGVPTLYVAIENFPEVRKYNISSIRMCFSGAAPLPMEVIRKFEELTGGGLVEGYGLTEASPVTHINPFRGTAKAGSIGVPVPDTDCKIVDIETGTRELEVGQAGEICIRGPQVMKGYWNKPHETKEALRDGWLYTGDIAKMDEDGYFYIVDRKKDMIIAGGYNIYPREIDEVLYSHPKVLDAVAVGIPDPYRGETVKAYIVLKEGQSATEEEIIEFCKKNLAIYKVPKLVEFRPALPKTLVGKVLRRVLREEEVRKKGEE